MNSKKTSNGDAAQGQPWTDAEVAAVVADYFHMLRLELSGQKYNKTQHRRSLQQMLESRSDSSIENKHQNISAVLLDLGVMPINGYKPLFNYQALLAERVAAVVASDSALDAAALAAVVQHAEVPELPTFENFVLPIPRIRHSVEEERLNWRGKTAVRRDYLERESRNKALGDAGETLALQFEVHRLHSLGLKRLSDRVEHTSSVCGDGFGFDILSFEEDGRERFIEVKTTAFNAATPFFISENERDFSSHNADQFHLYRIFNFRARPKMYTLPGAVNVTCRLDPVSYRALPL